MNKTTNPNPVNQTNQDDLKILTISPGAEFENQMTFKNYYITKKAP